MQAKTVLVTITKTVLVTYVIPAYNSVEYTEMSGTEVVHLSCCCIVTSNFSMSYILSNS